MRRLTKQRKKANPDSQKTEELHTKWKEAKNKMKSKIRQAKNERLREKAKAAQEDRTGGMAWKIMKEAIANTAVQEGTDEGSLVL